MNEQLVKRKEELLSEIARFESIVGLENTDGFKNFLNYFQESLRIADETWHNIDDCSSKEFLNLRVSKIAATNVLEFINYAKNELENLRRELSDINEEIE